jgi:peptidoglycan/LPS O-acetylase OafA/YrhL
MTAPEHPFEAFAKTRYFPSLDGLRALCVTLVMFNHVHVRTPSHIHAALGVYVFFVLSGFLITTLLLREEQKGGRISLKGFYTRRFFRIIPVYLFTILLYGLVLVRMHDPARSAQFKAALPWLLTFMEEFKPHAAGNIFGHAWTLGIEEKFYLFWPLLVIWLLPFRGRKALPLIALGVGVLLLRSPFDASYAGLLLGAMVAIALSAQAGWTILRWVARVPDVLPVLLVAFTFAYFNTVSNAHAILFCAATGLLIASLVVRPGVTRTVLENPMLVFIGKRSYSLYLIHVLVINLVESALGRYTALNWFNVVGLSLLIGLAGASLMHVAIEIPCIALGGRLSRRFARAEPVSQPAT